MTENNKKPNRSTLDYHHVHTLIKSRANVVHLLDSSAPGRRDEANLHVQYGAWFIYTAYSNNNSSAARGSGCLRG